MFLQMVLPAFTDKYVLLARFLRPGIKSEKIPRKNLAILATSKILLQNEDYEEYIYFTIIYIIFQVSLLFIKDYIFLLIIDIKYNE